MNIILKSLELKNFKGIRDRKIDFKDDTTISGDNATGKTTLFDAYSWLLWDKDSQNRADFQIKTIGTDGKAIPNIEHSVEATLNIDNTDYTFKKVYKEQWTKKRGQAQSEFTGHTTDYYINDVPVKKKDYIERIGSVTTEDEFKLLSSPHYFSTALKKDERRQILTDIIGDTDKDEILKQNRAFAKLDLSKYTIEEIKSKYKSQAKKANEKLKEVPIRIDEITKQIRELDFGTIEMRKNALTGSLSVLKGEVKAAGHTAKKIQELTEKLKDLEIRKNQTDIDAKRQYQKQIADIKDKQYQTQKDIQKHQTLEQDLKTRIQDKTIEINKAEETLKQNRDKWVDIRKETYKGDNTCPSCGQKLPEEKIQQAIEKFNLKKSQDLRDIEEKSEKLKKENENRKKEVEDMKKTLQEAQQEQENLKRIYDTLNEEESEIKPPDISELISGIQAQTDDIQKQLSDIGASSDEEKREKIQKIEKELEEVNQKLMAKQINEDIKKQVKSYEQEEKELAKTYEEAQEYLYIVEQYERAYADTVTDKINALFKKVKFKLFDEQINGGLVPTCEAMIDNVAYSDLNSAAKINAGLDIINTVSDRLNKHVPVFIDNAESINDIMKPDTQVIKLVVSKDKELKIAK